MFQIRDFLSKFQIRDFLSKFQIRDFLSKFQKCLTKTDLKNLKEAIGNYYIDKGYMLARVYFGLQNIMQGKIEIIIEEGKASTLEIKDDSKINDALPDRKQRNLNLSKNKHKITTQNVN